MKEQRYFPKKSDHPDRDENIRKMFEVDGISLNELAKAHNLTKVRIHQIIHGRVVNRAAGATEERHGGS